MQIQYHVITAVAQHQNNSLSVCARVSQRERERFTALITTHYAAANIKLKQVYAHNTVHNSYRKQNYYLSYIQSSA